jgi:hypothetical protein
MVVEGFIANEEGVVRSVRRETDDLHPGRRRDFLEGGREIPHHGVKPACRPVAVGRDEGDRAGVV